MYKYQSLYISTSNSKYIFVITAKYISVGIYISMSMIITYTSIYIQFIWSVSLSAVSVSSAGNKCRVFFKKKKMVSINLNLKSMLNPCLWKQSIICQSNSNENIRNYPQQNYFSVMKVNCRQNFVVYIEHFNDCLMSV